MPIAHVNHLFLISDYVAIFKTLKSIFLDRNGHFSVKEMMIIQS